MKKFSVIFEKRTLFAYEVNAANEEQADEIATELFRQGKPADKVISTEAEVYEIEEIN